MPKFKVWAKYTNYCWVEVEAKDKEEAEYEAERMDGGDFEQEKDSFDDGGWEIVDTMTKEIEE